jgi:hypothetical protein
MKRPRSPSINRSPRSSDRFRESTGRWARRRSPRGLGRSAVRCAHVRARSRPLPRQRQQSPARRSTSHSTRESTNARATRFPPAPTVLRLALVVRAGRWYVGIVRSSLARGPRGGKPELHSEAQQAVLHYTEWLTRAADTDQEAAVQRFHDALAAHLSRRRCSRSSPLSSA